MKATVKILRNDRNVPQGKLADAELHFTGGELDGLKLIGFAVWQRRDGVGTRTSRSPHVSSPFTARNAVSRCCARSEIRAYRTGFGSSSCRRTPRKSMRRPRRPLRRAANNSARTPPRGGVRQMQITTIGKAEE